MFLRKTARTWSWKSFFKGEVKGSIAIESALLLPVFALIFVGSTTLFQIQRVDSSYLHATTTINDLVTRQVEITDDRAEEYYATARSLVASDDNLTVTITSVSYNAADEEFYVLWSSSNIDGQEHEDEDIQGYDFPAMDETESVILVTLQGSVAPLFDGILGTEVNLSKHSIRRPRLVRLVDRKP